MTGKFGLAEGIAGCVTGATVGLGDGLGILGGSTPPVCVTDGTGGAMLGNEGVELCVDEGVVGLDGFVGTCGSPKVGSGRLAGEDG